MTHTDLLNPLSGSTSSDFPETACWRPIAMKYISRDRTASISTLWFIPSTLKRDSTNAAFRASAILRVDSDRRSLSVDHLQLKRQSTFRERHTPRNAGDSLGGARKFTVVPIKMDTSTIR
ncbi:MAG: hypothetical protein R3C68_19690 [Myxococcota bacterium]